ncbi:hypothetical protein WJX81_006844 [Elliptochloris bilobata]|uniref:Uncharacterized protein n=1 Tax=Elliptochloris bilobata TaxID=381761 RepID=A0AAW1RU31_9CHLO
MRDAGHPLRAARLPPLSWPTAKEGSWLAHLERSLHDATYVARNVVTDARLVPGSGAMDTASSRGLSERTSAGCCRQVAGPHHAVGTALECRCLGADRNAGAKAGMKELGMWYPCKVEDPYQVELEEI